MFFFRGRLPQLRGLCVLVMKLLIRMSHSLLASRLLPAHAVCGMLSMVAVAAAAEQKRNYDLPRGEAATMLARFAEQSGRPVLFAMDKVRGARTNVVVGNFSPAEALDRLLAGTELIATFDRATGDIVVTRRPPPAPAEGQRATPLKNIQPEQTASPPVKNRNLFSFLAGWLAVGAGLDAQTAPSLTKDEAVQLSPFTVSTGRDYGFVATSSLAGGRLAGELKDTPVAYSVLTRDFIDALNLTDLAAAANWTVNSAQEVDNGSNLIFGSPTTLSFRGAGSGAAQRDFFRYPNTNFDSFNLERFDFARGPNAVLFGIGGVGGTANLVAKQALLGRSLTILKFTAGSWGNSRGELDVNQPLTNDLAVRINLLGQQRDDWRDHLWEKKKAAHIAASWRPLKRLELRAEAEWGRFSQTNSLTLLADSISGWDGITTYQSPTASSPANSDSVGVARSTGYVFSNLLPFAYNSAGMMRSVGGNNSTAVPAGGTLVIGPTASISGQPVLNQINLPGNLYSLAAAGSAFRLPSRSFTLASDAPGHDQNYRLFSGFLNYQLGSHLFFELAATALRDRRDLELISIRGISSLYIDVTKTLPTGEPNPGYLQPYSQAPRQNAIRLYENTGLRAAAAYVLDNTRFGNFRFSLLAGQSDESSDQRSSMYVVKRNTDIRRVGFADPLNYQIYWNGSRSLRDISTITDTDGRSYGTGWMLNLNDGQQASDITLKNLQAAFSAATWKRRIHLVGAVRRDDYEARNFASKSPMDYPANWDGVTKFFKPAAPSDYGRLGYAPKDASGLPSGPASPADARPRDANGVGLPQYAADRFRDDYSAPDANIKVTTFSAGAVWHFMPWFSTFANAAETFSPGPTLAQIDGSVLPPSVSKGWDAGIRLTLLAGRLSASLNRYEGSQDNSAAQPGVGSGIVPAFPTAINSIVNANAVGDLTAGGYNKRGLPPVPSNYNDRRLRETKGYELEVTANPNKRWRVSLNVALPKAYGSDAFPDTRAYLARNDAVLRQIVQDAGVIIGSNGVAVVDQTVPAGVRSPNAAAAATSWNDLQNNLKNLAAGRQILPRSTDFTGNVFTDYTFESGLLRNLKIGGGVNFRGREVIGFRGAETMLDPNNRSQAIDDPSVDQYTPVYRQRYHLVTAVVGYRWRLKKGGTISVDLRVANALNEDGPLYYTVVARPLNGDLRSPARISTPGQYSYQTPRSFSLTTTWRR